MRNPLGQLGRAIVGPFLPTAMLFLLISPVLCHAQIDCPEVGVGAESTYVCMSWQPTITSISPTTWIAGKATVVTIEGSFLGAWVKVDTGSVELDSLMYPQDGSGPFPQFQWQYVATPDASDPTEKATVVVGFIEGNPYLATATVQICGAPIITSIKPSTWFAGKTYDSVVIKGTGFTTTDKATADCPVTAVNITAADGSVVPVSGVNVDSDKKITLTVAPPANDTTQTATVTLGTAPNTGNSASLATPPQILGNEIHCDPSMNCTQDVISTTDGSEPPVQSVDTGQPVILTTNPNLPASINPYKTTWTVDGTRIAGYNPTTGPTNVTRLTDADLKKANINYYWVYPKSAIPVTYIYCVNIPGVGNQCSEEAKASFNVTGPGDVQMQVDAYDRLNIDMLIDKNACLPILDDEDPYMEYGNISGYESPCPGTTTGNPQGIIFTPPTPSGGTYSFAQLIQKDTTIYSFGKNVLSCPTIPGLDAVYPYPKPPPDYNETWDYPSVKLWQFESRVSRTFNATMYLLWKSSIPNSIPVPIGSQKWTIAQGRTRNSGYPTDQKWAQPVWNALGKNGDLVNYVKTAPSTSPYGYPTWNGRAAAAPVPGCPTDNTQADGTQQEEEQ
jgi:hypothetical protein